mmetsp:Transcript_102243/g.288859  ORF Transcript_102243/g.288859 Transcript_102243/m.288859 type:complete len:291 (-) Transcript_102243:284-1156(-)
MAKQPKMPRWRTTTDIRMQACNDEVTIPASTFILALLPDTSNARAKNVAWSHSCKTFPRNTLMKITPMKYLSSRAFTLSYSAVTNVSRWSRIFSFVLPKAKSTRACAASMVSFSSSKRYLLWIAISLHSIATLGVAATSAARAQETNVSAVGAALTPSPSATSVAALSSAARKSRDMRQRPPTPTSSTVRRTASVATPHRRKVCTLAAMIGPTNGTSAHILRQCVSKGSSQARAINGKARSVNRSNSISAPSSTVVLRQRKTLSCRITVRSGAFSMLFTANQAWLSAQRW